jgi:transposase
VKAYSVDVREKVLQAVDQGYPRSEIIKLLGVSRATIKRYLKQRRETGNISVDRFPVGPPRNVHPCRLAWLLSCRRIPTRPWRRTARSGSKSTACA